jgi:hypothetical protein
MSLPYTTNDIVRSNTNTRIMVDAYFRNLTNSTKNAAKLLCASIAACIHGLFPSMCKYTPLSVCLSIVEHDLIHNNVPKLRSENHLHDV